mgnify:CR=1 FL=1
MGFIKQWLPYILAGISAGGQYALIEFKLGSREIEEGAQHLLQIKQLVQAGSSRARTSKTSTRP